MRPIQIALELQIRSKYQNK